MLNTLNSRLRFLLWLIALPGIVIVLIQALLDRNTAIELNQREAVRISEDLATTQRRLISQTQNFLEHLAATPPVHDPAHPDCAAFLRLTLGMVPQFANIGVPLPDGSLLCNALPLDQPINLFDRPYFQYSLTKRGFAISAFQQDRVAGVPSIIFSVPVQPYGPDGDIVGVAVAVVSLDWWSQQLNDHPLPDGTISFISNDDGTIIANHPADLHEIGNPVSGYGLTRGLLRSSKPNILIGDDGMPRVFTHQPLIRDQDGRVISVSVGIPIGPALAATNQKALTRFLALIAAIFAVWILVRRLVHRDILRPLAALTNSISHLEAGQDHLTTPRDQNTSRVREFLQLNRRFASMAGARHAAELSEQRQREEMVALLDALPDLYFRLDAQGVILDYRTSKSDDLYVPPEQFMGRKIVDVLPKDIHGLFENKLFERLETNNVVSFEYKLAIRGEVQDFEGRACPIRATDETVLVVRNITDSKRAEDQIRLSAMIYENSSEGMAIVDSVGQIVTMNPAISRLTGYAVDELVGQPFDDLLVSTDRETLRNNLPGTRDNGKGWHGEVSFLRRTGEAIPVRLSVNAIHGGAGEVQRFVILSHDMTEVKRANQTIWWQAHYDELTGLPNRASSNDRLRLLTANARDHGTQVALLFLDLDGLKQVNDRLGHDAGDQLLAEVAVRLRTCVRPEDFVARQGGDEFTIILAKQDKEHRAQQVANCALEAMARPFRINGETVHLTASLGVAIFPDDANTPEDLVKAADQAMYAAKSAGRNRFNRFTPAIQQAASDKTRLIHDLTRALETHQFTLHFQPIVDLATGRIAKAEALIRWSHPDLGTILPSRFIPLAEEAGMISPIGDWVLDQSCADLPTFQNWFGEGFQICLNVSPKQLSAQDTGAMAWPDRLARAGLDGSAFIAEITEGALLEQGGQVAQHLAALRGAGLNLALDDFGTGYSSLLYFFQHEFDYLKVDREFVRHLPDGPNAIALCETLVGLARRVGVKVIAEGIETQAQNALLTQIGCDFGQGYRFAPALPLQEFLSLPPKFDRP